MSKNIYDYPVGGATPVHFHEDGAIFTQAASSDVFDLGEMLSGFCIRVYLENTFTTSEENGVAIEIYASDNKDAALTSDKWIRVANFTAASTATDGYVGGYMPLPGEACKYWYAKVTGVFSGAIRVYTELVPGR